MRTRTMVLVSLAVLLLLDLILYGLEKTVHSSGFSVVILILGMVWNISSFVMIGLFSMKSEELVEEKIIDERAKLERFLANPDAKGLAAVIRAARFHDNHLVRWIALSILAVRGHTDSIMAAADRDKHPMIKAFAKQLLTSLEVREVVALKVGRTGGDHQRIGLNATDLCNLGVTFDEGVWDDQHNLFVFSDFVVSNGKDKPSETEIYLNLDYSNGIDGAIIYRVMATLCDIRPGETIFLSRKAVSKEV